MHSFARQILKRQNWCTFLVIHLLFPVSRAFTIARTLCRYNLSAFNLMKVKLTSQSPWLLKKIMYLLFARMLRIRIPSLYFWPSRIRSAQSSSKNSKKNLDFDLFETSLWLLFVKNYINEASRSEKQKKKLVLVAVSKVSDENSKILTRSSKVRISRSRSGSVPKCHRSATLLCKRKCRRFMAPAWHAEARRRRPVPRRVRESWPGRPVPSG